MSELDDPSRIDEIRTTIARKPALKFLYKESYDRIRRSISSCHAEGAVLELGSGGGFARECIPGLITSDIISYPYVDIILDGTALPFADASFKAIFMINVLHHIRDAAAFFRDAERTLAVGGRIFIVDPYPGIIGGPIYRYFHHEPFVPESADWRLSPEGGPLSQANIALAWMIFVRDRSRFNQLFPSLKVTAFAPHTPLRYWLTGGLKQWCLIPECAFGIATKIDRLLVKLSPELGCFVDIELLRE